MAAPVWKWPETFNGRLEPGSSTPQGSPILGIDESGYDYGSKYYYLPYGYYYYSGYGINGAEHVFCLGSDSVAFEKHRLNINDAISVEQTFSVPVASQLLRFAWHMRTPSMPERRVLISNGRVEFKTAGLLGAGTGTAGILLIDHTDLFTADDTELLVRITGAPTPANNGIYRVSAIPARAGYVTFGTVAIIENASIVAEIGSNVTVEVLGLRWVGRAYTDIGGGMIERFNLVEPYGHTWFRNALALNVSKYSGAITVKFEMKLELVS